MKMKIFIMYCDKASECVKWNIEKNLFPAPSIRHGWFWIVIFKLGWFVLCYKFFFSFALSWCSHIEAKNDQFNEHKWKNIKWKWATDWMFRRNIERKKQRRNNNERNKWFVWHLLAMARSADERTKECGVIRYAQSNQWIQGSNVHSTQYSTAHQIRRTRLWYQYRFDVAFMLGIGLNRNICINRIQM